jgi:predicted nucleic acid-binding protein
MLYLVDSNVLLRLLQRGDPLHALVRAALRTLRSRGDGLCYTSQILGEFWNVCTRPASARGGFGLPVPEADRRARLIERHYALLPDSLAVHTEWRGLLVAHSVSGVQVHDARLVAAMNVHGVGSGRSLAKWIWELGQCGECGEHREYAMGPESSHGRRE